MNRRRLVLHPDDRAGSAARAVLRVQLRRFGREVAGARAGEVEPVHQLRVATRRLRAALAVFAPVVAGAETLREELSWVGRQIGAVRDLDVLGEAVGARARALGPARCTALAPVVEEIRARRVVAHRALVRALDARRSRVLLARLDALAAAPGSRRDGARLGELAPDHVRPLVRAVRRAGRHLDADAPAEALPRLRVRAKRLRYALESLAALAPDLPKLIGGLERLQEILGAHQDAVTQAAWLERHVEETTLPPRTLVAIGMVIAGLEREGRRMRRRFPRAWAKVAPRLRGRVLGVAIAPRPRLRLVRAEGA
ncbi:MAG: CHAD domain-containing protein [Candidatus Binatia bacterium]